MLTLLVDDRAEFFRFVIELIFLCENDLGVLHIYAKVFIVYSLSVFRSDVMTLLCSRCDPMLTEWKFGKGEKGQGGSRTGVGADPN